MSSIHLAIDYPQTDLWVSTERRQMLHAGPPLAKLRWQYRITDGGLWSGSATVKIPSDTEAYERLVSRGAAANAWIYWDRDESDATALDETTDLIWFGVAEDAQADRTGQEVTLRLRGAGQYLKDSLYTGTHEGETLGTIAAAVLDAVVADTHIPVTTRDVDAGGVMARKVTLDFDNTPADRVLKRLAELAGGPSRVLWGVEPGATSDNYGQAFFRLWGGHSYEKDSSIAPTVYTIGRDQVVTYRVEALNSDIRNSVTVIGDVIDDPTPGSARTFYVGTATSRDSIDQFGMRRQILTDSSLKNDGVCAIKAAGIVKEKAARKLKADLKAEIDLDAGATEATKAKGVIQSTLARPSALLLVRDTDKTIRRWGDSQTAYRATRNTTTAAYSFLEFINAPTGSDAPTQDPTPGLSSGDKRLYVAKMAFGSTAYSSQGLSVMELLKRYVVLWVPSAGKWKLAVGWRNTSGTWAVLATSSTLITSAQLLSEHATALEVSYLSGTQHTVRSLWSDGTNAYQMTSNTVTNANLNTEGSAKFLNINAVASATGSTAPAFPGDCGTADYSAVEIYRDWSGNAQDFIKLHATEHAPWQRHGDLVCLANPAMTDSSTGYGWMRYAWGNATLDGEYKWRLQGDAADSRFGEVTNFTRRNYAWRLGLGADSAPYGTHLELQPMSATCEFSGHGSRVVTSIKGNVGLKPASTAIDELASRIQDVEENTRKSS